MMCKCARPDCHAPAKSSCSSCGREKYCSSSCQKLDWKIHKSMCPILKKLSNTQLQPFREAHRLITEIMISNKGKEVRILEHLLSFAEFQFGKEVSEISYRERGNGECISNWNVDMLILYSINGRLIDLYGNALLNIKISDKMLRPCMERSLKILNPWLIYLDTDAGNRLNEGQKHSLLQMLFLSERNMAVFETQQFDKAEGHCQRCLAYSKRFASEGETKTSAIYDALISYCNLKAMQDDFSNALVFAEEAYNLVAVAYNPVHPQVQKAAGNLIHVLITKGDLYDASRYAEVTYSNLRDKKNGMNQEGAEMAQGAFNLADVIYRQAGDLVNAEKLARESLRIRSKIFGKDSPMMCGSYHLLANILRVQNKLGDETKGLYDHSLRMCIITEGKDASMTAIRTMNFGLFYHDLAGIQPTAPLRRAQLLHAKSHFFEGNRIFLKIYGPMHPSSINSASQLATATTELSKIIWITDS